MTGEQKSSTPSEVRRLDRSQRAGHVWLVEEGKKLSWDGRKEGATQEQTPTFQNSNQRQHRLDLLRQAI
jgi:hypothetical protein